MSFPKLKEAESRLAAKQDEIRAIMAEAGPEFDTKKVKSVTGDVVDAIRALNEEANEIGKEVRNLKAVATIAAELPEASPAVERGDSSSGRKMSIGQVFAKSEARTNMGVKASIDVSLKTLMTRAAGWAPESLREGGYLPAASAPLMVTDLIPTLTTGQAAIKYMEQTTRTNNAAERAEGGNLGEAAFVLTERSVTVESLGVWLPVTEEQLEDEAEAAAMIDQDLPFMVRQRLDSQILVGDGSTPNILGVNNKPSIQTQAKSTDPTFDAIHKAITKVRVTGRAMPDAVVMHPNDWQDVRLTRTADGIYILGNPADAFTPQIWGLPVVISDNQTENTAVVGDFGNYARLYIRRDIVVEKTNSHASDFIALKLAVRATMRCATVWKRAAAYCTVTGI